ncbi:WD repeat-containing protein 6, partial [Coemansia sp. RSA 2610]
MSLGLELRHRRLPGSAVAFVSDRLLAAANGGSLAIYDVPAQAHMCSHAAFDHARIHGIAAHPADTRVLVFGAKCWTVLRIHAADRQCVRIERLCSGARSDWIKAAHWVQDRSGRWLVALALAHGQIHVLSADDGSAHTEDACSEPCIAYAAAFSGRALDDLRVCVGTVFGDVLVRRVHAAPARVGGHDGAVFGVAFLDNGAIASVSDDRAVRVWGAGGDTALFGHRARVWACVDLGGGLLVSASEDGTCRLWRGAETVDVWAQCAKNVWAVAASPDRRAVAAVGGDGSLCVWPVRAGRRVETLDELQGVALPEPNGEPRVPEFTRGFALGWDAALLVANSGRVLRYEYERAAWLPVWEDPVLRGYAMVAGCAGLAAVGMRDGSLVLFLGDSNQRRRAQLHADAVRWVSVAPRNAGVFDVFTAGEDGQVVWSRVTGDSWHMARVELPSARTRVASAAVSSDGQWLAVGSATGGVYVYAVSAGCFAPAALGLAGGGLHAACAWTQAHGRQTVSALAFDSDGLLVSGGRDGHVRTFRILAESPADADQVPASSLRQGTGAWLYVTHDVQLSSGWVEHLRFSGATLFAVTFFRKRLLLVDVWAQRVVLSTVCAGGAKQWQVLLGAHAVRVGFMKRTQLMTRSWPMRALAEPVWLDRGVSSVDLRAAVLLGDSADIRVNGRMCLAVVAGEDGHVRVLSDAGHRVGVVADVRRHRSAVRCLRLVSARSRLVLSAGAGSELRCWRIADSGLVEWAQPPPAAADRADLRIMDLAVVDETPDAVRVAAACSDGAVELWQLDVKQQQLACIARGAVGCCVFSVAAVNTADGRLWVLTGSSDGQICVWGISQTGSADLELVLKLSGVHQSGVNTLDAFVDTHNCITVASGGDDCQIAVTVIDTHTMSVVSHTRTLAHAAAVQGVCFIDKQMCSVSTDQRLAIWSPDMELQCMVVTQVADPSALDVQRTNAGAFIGIHTRTRDMKLLFISGGTRNATGFTPSDVVDKCVEDFVVEDYGADDFMGMYDLRSANSTDDDDASAYCWFTNLRHAQGMSVLHRIVSFKLDNCVIFIATAFPELPCTSHRELEVQVLDGQMSCLNATRKRKACEKLLKQCGQPTGDSRCRQAKAALVLEHPDSSEFEPPDPRRRTAGPLIAFVTGSVSQLVDADPSDLFRFPFMRLVAPEHLVLVSRFFARLNNTAEVLFEKFSLLQRPHVIEGDVEVRDVENNRVHVECLASAVDDG